MSLTARHYWCLSGTPIVNKALDVCALLRFCRVPLLGERSVFTATIIKAFKASFIRGCALLRQSMKPICLRRSNNLIPRPRDETCSIDFSPAERQGYDAIFASSQRQIEAMASGQDDKPSKSVILNAILQLRMFCNNGLSPTSGATVPLGPQDLGPDETLTLLQQRDEALCVSCHSDITLINQMQDSDSGLMGSCNHVLCRSCLEKEGPNECTKSFTCPECKSSVQVQDLAANERTPGNQPAILEQPSKLARLVDNLTEFGSCEKR